MQDKIKIIVLVFVAAIVLVGMMFLTLKVKSLEGERQELQSENSNLNAKISALTTDNEGLQKKVGALTKNLEDTNQQKTEVQKKYDLLVQEKDSLSNEITKLKADLEKSLTVKVADPAPAMNDAYLASILKQKADLEVQLSMMRDTFKNLKSTNEQLALEKNALSIEVANLSRDTQDIQNSSEYNQKMVDNLTQELAHEKTDKLEMAKRLKAARAESLILRQQIVSLGEKKMTLEKKLTEIQSKNSTLEKSLASMELYIKQQLFQMDDLRNQFSDTRGSKTAASSSPASRPSYQDQVLTPGRKDAIQLPPIVVKPQGQPNPNTPSLGDQAKIVSIDRDNNFVVINVGRASNIKMGDIFQVYRDKELLGSVEVIQARERIAACDIKSESVPFRIGDMIR